MTTVEQLIKKARALPPPLQNEALHYVDYLTEKHREADIEWSRFGLETALRGIAPGQAGIDNGRNSFNLPAWSIHTPPEPTP